MSESRTARPNEYLTIPTVEAAVALRQADERRVNDAVEALHTLTDRDRRVFELEDALWAVRQSIATEAIARLVAAAVAMQDGAYPVWVVPVTQERPSGTGGRS